MEADWDEITRIAVPPPGPQAPLATASCVLVFDDNQELLWTGNEHGRVTSFYGRELQRYTSVKAHTNEGEVRSLLMHEKGVISLASRSVHLITRRGLTQWHLTHERMLDLRCMSFTSTPTQLLVAGCQSTMFVIDVERGVLLEEIPTTANYTMMKKGRHICAATNDGTIHVISPANLEIVMTWKSAVIIKDMDAQGDFLVTCRSSVRQLGVSVVDPLANVYDLKNLKQMSPIPFPAGAALIRLHPKLQTTSFVASQTGQMQVVDLMNPVSIIMRQANVHTMQGMELSPSGNALAITDHAGYIHLWGSPANIRFNNVNKTIEFADPQPSNIPHVDWNDTPLNTIGMPYYHDKLLSAWPSHLIFDIGAPPPAPLEPAMMPNFQRAEMGYYHTNMNPKGLHRYQIEDTRTTLSAGSIATPKFLSEKARKSPENTFGRRLSDAVNALAGTTLNGKPITDEERMLKYSNVEIKYSRFGVDDFDFKYYNKTPFSGLETHIANSFINSLLQLYKFVPRIRNLALHHTATRCVSEKCLMCEFGFLFDMLERAQGQNCQATNLLRAFGANRDAAALSLFEDAALAGGVPLSSTIQSVNRFFLKHLADDWRSVSVTAEAVDEVLGTSAFEVIRCMYCGGETNRPGAAYVHDLLYPQLDPKHGMHNSLFMFSSILKATIERENKNRGWCNKCRRYQQLVTRKILQQLPVVLMLNTALTNPAMRALWEKPGWLPQKLGILLQNRQVYCLEGKELDREQQRNPSIAVYELVGFVAGVDVNDRHQPHLVSMINVDISKKQPDGLPKHRGFPDWHLFNDFLVQPVDPREALDFSKGWKLPSVLAYQLQSAHGMVDDNWKAALDTSLLYLPHYSINGKPPTSDCIMLTSEEHPKDGVPIALDTEFVDLQKAEIDVKADGTQETIRPARSGLARVSVLRGQGDIEGSPFIDDYITINEPIVDYKTQFSGIRPGDLDTRVSHHNLVPLKVAYKKLWLLLNLGCVFVGHGLASDFRKVNIQVPKSQTVDTQYLYLAPGKNRRFSLKYLAWAVFKEYIQEDSLDLNDPDGHDSIEDARMALRLWRKFQEYEDAGITEQMIEDIYRKGSKYGWKPPARDGTIAASNSGLPSGRNTPDLNGASTPTPVTPAKGLLRLSASNVPAFAPGMAIIRESPLR